MSAKKLLDLDGQKKLAAHAALKLVKPGMKVGLGSGSTANHFIKALGEKARAGLDVTGIPTSKATFELAKASGVPIGSLEDFPFLDLVVDGADEIDPDFRLIKGGGGALLVEKIVGSSARELVIIADESKQVKKLGKFPLPIEVVALGVKATGWKLERIFKMVDMAPKMALRMKDGQPFRTDMGNLIIDCACGEIKQPDRLEVMLNNLPGVVNNGLFIGMASLIIIGRANGTVAEIAKA